MHTSTFHSEIPLELRRTHGKGKRQVRASRLRRSLGVIVVSTAILGSSAIIGQLSAEEAVLSWMTFGHPDVARGFIRDVQSAVHRSTAP